MANIQALGELINWVDVRNKGVISDNLLGINIDKFFMPSVANIIGTDLSSYKLIRKKQFACNPMHVGRDEKMPIALYMDDSPSIVSPAYFVFEIKDAAKVNPEYLMLWFRRAEFDRECWYHTDGSVRGGITWDEILEMTVPVPSIEEQNELVKSYRDIERRIQIKKEINDNLESQAKTLYTEALNRSPQLFEDKFLTDVCNIRYGKGLQTAELLDRGYYVFGSNGLIGYYDSYMYETEQTTISCRGASSGQVNITLPKAFVTSNSLILEPKVLSVYQYIKWYALTHSFEEYVTGSAQPQLTIDSLVATQVKMPINDIPILRISLEKYSHCIYLNRLELLALDKNKNNLLSVILSR